MLFNSYEFIFLFLPLTLLGFHLIGKQGHHRVAIAWLICASLFFYGWWNPAYLLLMLFSVLFNYSVGVSLSNASGRKLLSKTILTIGVSANLAILGYFKYANFFVDNLNALSGTNLILNEVILPLAISFFTFQQITYIADANSGKISHHNIIDYCLFVTFFPQLIAGPIVHHSEMMPQFRKASIFRTRNPKLVNPMKEKRVWVQVAKNFEPIIKLTEEDVQKELFDFDEPIILSASDLGKGKHKVSAEIFASWNKHTYIEKNEEKMHSQEIEIEIN